MQNNIPVDHGYLIGRSGGRFLSFIDWIHFECLYRIKDTAEYIPQLNALFTLN